MSYTLYLIVLCGMFMFLKYFELKPWAVFLHKFDSDLCEIFILTHAW